MCAYGNAISHLRNKRFWTIISRILIAPALHINKNEVPHYTLYKLQMSSLFRSTGVKYSHILAHSLDVMLLPTRCNALAESQAWCNWPVITHVRWKPQNRGMLTCHTSLLLWKIMYLTMIAWIPSYSKKKNLPRTLLWAHQVLLSFNIV